MIRIAIIIVVFIFSFFTGRFHKKHELAPDMKNLNYYQETFLRKQGFSLGFGNYDLRSFDGGKNWCAIERTDDWGVKILGPAEEVFPGLLEHLAGWDALMKYVEENGSITLSGKRVAADKVALKAAGFEVKEKEKE